jgi:hypothetical protein
MAENTRPGENGKSFSVDTEKLDASRGYLEGSAGAADSRCTALVAAYKKDVCKSYISLNPDQIGERLGGTTFFVTRKYDGELAVLFWNGKDCFSVNSGGRLRMGLPCLEEAGKLFLAAGLGEAVIPAELYLDEENGRSRVFETLSALADKSLLGKLRLALFDIVSLNGKPYRSASYAETHKKLGEICAESGVCRPVRMDRADSKAQVKDIFAKWVSEEGGEGLVVRSELPMIYKVKPRYSIDVVVVGFSEGTGETKGQVRTLLVALMDENGVFQIIGRCGNGFGDDLKQELFPKLLAMKLESKYVETDSNHVAFHMIRPEIVIELTINDVLFETSSGPILNPRLELKNNVYRRIDSVHGASVVFPIFERIREDKKVSPQDVRLSQLNEINYNPYGEVSGQKSEAAASALLRREVYRKTLGAKLMVQKFLVWKTNKENDGYPAYVLAYTNYSSDRAEPLQSEMRVSNSEVQILGLLDDFMEKNIKKGWEKV